MNTTDVIAYTADADHWCEACAARAYGPDHRCPACGATFPGFVAACYAEDCPGDRTYSGLRVRARPEPTGRMDSEGNDVRPVFAGDEWWEPSDPGCEVLACGSCRAPLDAAHGCSCVEFGGEVPCSIPPERLP